ncbi:hypothetical protein [Fibrella aestuarina]|nr:hypothetical protein [Fibrella aestuarina]
MASSFALCAMLILAMLFGLADEASPGYKAGVGLLFLICLASACLAYGIVFSTPLPGVLRWLRIAYLSVIPAGSLLPVVHVLRARIPFTPAVARLVVGCSVIVFGGWLASLPAYADEGGTRPRTQTMPSAPPPREDEVNPKPRPIDQ